MRRGAPVRGDWIELPETHDIETPKLPRRRPAWLAATRRQWEAWWRDPAAVMWGPADIAAVEQLAVLVDTFERGDARIAPEIRLRLDGLGLTGKGKRDLRYRVVPAEEQTEKRFESFESFKQRREHLRAVEPVLAAEHSRDLRHLLEEG